MTQEERLLAQHALLLVTKKITTEQICQEFEISPDSARRDLNKLADFSDVQRIRGGAIIVPVHQNSLPYLEREQMSVTKIALGKAAANLVNEDDYIIIDSGTSLTAMATQLDKPTTVVTNSIDCLTILADNEDINVHLLGGQLNHFHRAILGAKAEQQLLSYQVNKVFLGVCALSELGVSTSTEAEASLKKIMMRQAQQVILLCDSSKFDQQNFHTICTLAQVDIIISDQRPTPQLMQLIDQHNIKLIIANDQYNGENNAC